MRVALLLALGSMVGWGVWSFMTKLATRTLAPDFVLVVSYGFGTLVAFGYVLLNGDVPTAPPPRGLAFALAAGLASGLGSAAYYTALDVGNISIVSTVTALYFVVAVVLGVIVLRESLDPSDVAGMLLAVGAVALLAR